MDWFNNLSAAEKIAIIVPVGLAAIGGLFKLFKWIFKEKGGLSIPQTKIQQKGTGHTAIVTKGNGDTVAGRDVHTGIEGDLALKQLVRVSKEAGQSEEKIKNYEDTITKLEEQLAQSQIMADAGGQQVPQPTQEAKDLAAHIEDNTGSYALALKAIASGDTKQADELLDNTQKLLDKVQEKKDRAQAKVYTARMQNALYTAEYQEALQWCDKLHPLVSEDPQTIGLMGEVYYHNAQYTKAEPLMRRALAIDESSFGPDHPNVAIRLNNLAGLLANTNRLDEAKPLMRRALAIGESSFGPDHPKVATYLNNLADLLRDTNRLDEAEPMMRRALAIDESSFGPDHPDVARNLNNLAELLRDTNRLDEAEPMYRRALSIDESSFGPDHPNVAIRLNNLALLLLATNRLDEAEPLMRRALDIDEKSLGPNHPRTITVRQNIQTLQDLIKEQQK